MPRLRLRTGLSRSSTTRTGWPAPAAAGPRPRECRRWTVVHERLEAAGRRTTSSSACTFRRAATSGCECRRPRWRTATYRTADSSTSGRPVGMEWRKRQYGARNRDSRLRSRRPGTEALMGEPCPAKSGAHRQLRAQIRCTMLDEDGFHFLRQDLLRLLVHSFSHPEGGDRAAARKGGRTSHRLETRCEGRRPSEQPFCGDTNDLRSGWAAECWRINHHDIFRSKQEEGKTTVAPKASSRQYPVPSSRRIQARKTGCFGGDRR
jgi:hypothetical protein